MPFGIISLDLFPWVSTSSPTVLPSPLTRAQMSLRNLHICKSTYTILVFLPHWGCVKLQIRRVFLFEFFHFVLIHNFVGEQAGKTEVIKGGLKALLYWQFSETFIDGGCDRFAITIGGDEYSV